MAGREQFAHGKSKTPRQTANQAQPPNNANSALISSLNKTTAAPPSAAPFPPNLAATLPIPTAHPGDAADADDSANTDTNFRPIIADIMRGYGDCDHPLDDTVDLVERILLQQLRAILHDVIDVAMQRKGRPEPTRTDFEHLMRRSPTKVHRLQQHIKDLQLMRKLEDQKSRAVGLVPQLTEDELDTKGASSDGDETTAAERQVAARFDEEKIRRLFRADRISQQLNGVQYMRYNEARRTSFCCKNSPRIRVKLRRWLCTEFVLSNQAFTILAYLAHETIATLVDLAILTRLHSGNRLNEPFGRVVSAKTSHTMLHLCPEVTQGRGMDGIRPITTQEVNEAMRRLAQGAGRTMGLHRNLAGRVAMPFLAL